MNKKENIELTEFLDFLSTLEKGEGNLIIALHKVQDIFGYISKENMIIISENLNIPASTVYGVASFYSHFKALETGKNVVSVCTGTACFVKGANNILDEIKKELDIEIGQTTEDGVFTLEDVRCIGACGLAPVVNINGKIYGEVKKEDVKGILNKYRPGGEFYKD